MRPDKAAVITGEVLYRMTYARTVVKEILRFRPPAPMVPQVQELLRAVLIGESMKSSLPCYTEEFLRLRLPDSVVPQVRLRLCLPSCRVCCHQQQCYPSSLLMDVFVCFVHHLVCFITNSGNYDRIEKRDTDILHVHCADCAAGLPPDR